MATPAATLELDPIFLKALRLLHSKAKDSADQLRQMLDDVLHHRPISSGIGSSSSLGQRDYAKPTIPSTKVTIKQESGSKLILSTTKKTSPKHPSDVLSTAKKSSSSRDDDGKKAEKRTFDKVIKQEAVESTGPDTKRAKIESPKPSPSPSPPPVLRIEIKKETEDFSTDDWNTDADDFAMEMGLACIICRNIEVSPGNQLVECQECHNLYHQECHRPAITDQDVNDPRVVWYCTKCAKNIKKLTIKTQKTSKTAQPTIVKEPLVPTKAIKAEPPAPSLSATHLFKRAEIKSTLAPSSSSSSSRSSSSSSGKPIGLAGLAASLTGKSSSLAKPSSQLGNHGSKPLSLTKPSAVLPNLTKAATSSVGATPSATATSQSGKGSGPFAALTSSIKSPTPSGSSSTASLSSKSSSSSISSSSSSKAAPSSSGNGNGNGSGKLSSSSMMSADKRLQIMKKKAEKKKQEKRWTSK